MGNMKKANYIISVIMLWVGVGVVALASSLKIKIGEGDPGAGFWPMMLGILIIVFSVCLLPVWHSPVLFPAAVLLKSKTL